MHERFNDISILRCSAMLMIVFYHCLCAYGVWEYGLFYRFFSTVMGCIDSNHA